VIDKVDGRLRGQLDGVNPRRVLNRFRERLRRVGIGFGLAGFEISYNRWTYGDLHSQWQPHVHAVIVTRMSEAEITTALSKHYKEGPGIEEPVRTSRLETGADLVRTVTYCMKLETVERNVYLDPLTGKPRTDKKRQCARAWQRCEHAMALSVWDVDELVMLFGIQRRGSRLVPSRILERRR
jgi:hypothetical protein